MKKMHFIWYGFLLLILVIFVSNGVAQQKPISKNDLPDLKGKWVGDRSFGSGTRLNTDLEISNDTLPVEGKFIFHEVGRRGGSPGRSETIDFKGKINEKGNLYIKGGNVEVELSLYQDGDKRKLEGNYFWAGAKGTLSFKKK